MRNMIVGFFVFTAMALTANAQMSATSVVVKQDMIAEAKYYVRYDFVEPKVFSDLGLVNETTDNEGYCNLIARPVDSYTKPVVLHKGEVLRLVGQVKWERFHVDQNIGLITVLKDVYSELKTKDGSRVFLACSVDTGAAERNEYKPISDAQTRAYLSGIGLIVK